MAADGSFFRTERTKPHGYSLSTSTQWPLSANCSLPEKKIYGITPHRTVKTSIRNRLALSIRKDKSSWKRQPDIMFWEEWPVATVPLFGTLHHFNKEYFNTWMQLEHFPTNEEVVRNLPSVTRWLRGFNKTRKSIEYENLLVCTLLFASAFTLNA